MAGSTTSHDHLIAAFESRFDYLTARTMVSQVLDTAGIPRTDAYDGAALARITSSVEKVVQRPDAILARLQGVAAPAAKAEPAKAEPAKAEPVKSEPAKAEPAKAEPVKAEPVKAEPAAKAAAPAVAPDAAPAQEAAPAEVAPAKPAKKK